MCRMLAKVSVLPTGIMEELEQCPNSLLWLSENGRKSHDPDVRGRHNDGCGMAYIDNSGNLKYTRHGKADFWSSDYRDFANAAQSRLYIAHNRFASEGLDLASSGAHPFISEKFGVKLAFCHNGAVDSYMEEAKKNTSDSEILLEKILGKTTSLSPDSVAESLSSIASETTYNSLCSFLLADKSLFIWRIFNEKNKTDYDRLNRYFTLHMSIQKNHVLIASEPLDENNWQLLPNNKMVALTPGMNKIEVEIMNINV